MTNQPATRLQSLKTDLISLATTRLFLALSGIVALVVGLFLYANFRIAEQALNHDLIKESNFYSETFRALQTSTENDLLLLSSTIASDHEVQNLFKQGRDAVMAEGGGAGGPQAARLRQQLYDLMIPRWRRASEIFDVRQLHFLFAPGAISFLRVHQPDQFGDDLSTIRFSVVDANTHLAPRTGFELGRISAGIRAVVPVFADSDNRQGNAAGQGSAKEHVGALEIGLAFTPIIDVLKDTTGNDVTVLLNQGLAEKVLRSDALAQNADIEPQGGHLVESSSRPLPDAVLDQIRLPTVNDFADNSTAHWQLIEEAGQYLSLTTYPLRDYLGQQQLEREAIGHIVIWRDITPRIEQFHSGQRQSMMFGLIAFLLVEGLILLGFRRVTQGLKQEIKTTAQALADSFTHRQFFEQILDSVDESVFLIDESGQFEYVNQSAVNRLGYPREVLREMGVSDVDPVFEFNQWGAHWAELRRAGSMTFESRHCDSQGNSFAVEISANYLQYRHKFYNLALVRDITQREQYEEELRNSGEQYHSIIETARDGFIMANSKGKIIEVNDSYCKMSGFSREHLMGRFISDLDAREDAQDVEAHIGRIIVRGGDIFETLHKRRERSPLPVEVAVSYSVIDGGRFFSFVRDIEGRKQHERMSALREELSTIAHQGDNERVLRTALDAAEELTHSEIAFYHFVDPGEKTISLQTWSTRTLYEMCTASGEETHYPIEQAGVWVDCIYQRQPVIYNDYSALTHRKGLPPGHAALQRFATVPIFRDKAIVAIIGVGNKDLDYDDADLHLLTRVGDIAYDFAQYSQTKHHVEYMAYYDVLTGLPNRELFFERLNQNIAQHSRSGELLALCYLDLDGFKPVNDEHGHDVGDQLLIRLGRRLQAVLREGDTIARIGGDEFVIMLTGLDAPSDAEVIVKRMISETATPFEVDGKRLYVSASVGITVYPTDDTNPDTLLRHADQAMYQAKQAGKSRYRMFELIEEERERSQRDIQIELHHGLKNGEFELFYQPRINLKDGHVEGVEALIRWHHPKRGLVAPNLFLPAIYGTPDEIALGEWVVRQALQQLAFWRVRGLTLPVSINISPEHIQQPGFTDFLRAELAKFPGDLASMVELEILETSAIGDVQNVSKVMRECADMGVAFSLDDFGTGYSSLTYFHQLPISILKIDQNFVRHMLDEPADLKIVKGVIHLAHTLGRPVVAEGVESIELALMLFDLGCQYAQGYGIAKPMPAARINAWLQEWAGRREWHELHKEMVTSDYDLILKVALFSHTRWQMTVMKYLTLSGASEKPLLEEADSDFVRWYQGIGKERYGHHPLYSFIPPRHRMVYKLAQDLVAYVDKGDTHAALSLIEVFNNASGDLIAKLQGLADD